jgi:hypothetical protein
MRWEHPTPKKEITEEKINFQIKLNKLDYKTTTDK